MITCNIPTYRKVENDGEKSYSVFLIEVSVYDKKYAIEKRYSEFEQLHRKMKYLMATAPFPPKSVLKFNHRFLENRRVALEAYLKSLLLVDQPAKAVLDFLLVQPQSHVKFDNDSLGGTDEETVSQNNNHQVVIAFNEHAYLQDTPRESLRVKHVPNVGDYRAYSKILEIESPLKIVWGRGGLPDIISVGILHTLYGSADDLH